MMSTEYLLPGYWNPDICIATLSINRPRLFTHWVPRLQALNESSLSQLHLKSTHSRLKFIDDYLESARNAQDKEYASVSLGTLESTHTRDKSTPSSPGETITARVASPSCTDSSPPTRRLPCPIIIPPYSKICNLDSPTIPLSSSSSLFSESMVESFPPEYLTQKNSTFRDDAGAPSSGGAVSVSIAQP